MTLFRVYPPGVEAAAAFQREISDPAYGDALSDHNAYNRRIFTLIHERAMRGEGVLLSWTDAYRHAAYDGQTGPPIPALKSFILSPWTDLARGGPGGPPGPGGQGAAGLRGWTNQESVDSSQWSGKIRLAVDHRQPVTITYAGEKRPWMIPVIT